MAKSELEIKELTRTFRIGGMIFGHKLTAVDHVSFFLPSDHNWILSIVGESGSGKTTMARMILGLLDISYGSIKIDNNDIKALKKDKKQFYRIVQPIFQNPFTTFSMKRTVESYLYETAINLGIAKSRQDADKLIDDVLVHVGMHLSQIRGKYPNQFSGGELQRISIARALIVRPKIIVADEPVAMVDASLRMNIVNLFKSLKDEYGVNFVYITHDLSTAYYVSDYIATMYKGSIVEFGESSLMMDNKVHPYTELLLNSIPRVGDKWDVNDRMTMADAEEKHDYEQGCKFVKRCPYAIDKCHTEKPEMVHVNASHEVLCFMREPDEVKTDKKISATV